MSPIVDPCYKKENTKQKRGRKKSPVLEGVWFHDDRVIAMIAPLIAKPNKNDYSKDALWWYTNISTTPLFPECEASQGRRRHDSHTEHMGLRFY